MSQLNVISFWDGKIMTSGRFFSVNDFARFSRTTSHTLRYYDKIGLLSPVSRGENNYRYYHSGQIARVNLIRTFQALGLTLDEINGLKDNLTPESIDDFFTCQIEKIDTKTNEWVRARKLLFTLQKSIRSVMDVNENEITIQFMPAEAIIFGELNDYSRKRNDYDALFSFYNTMSKKYPDMDMNYPVWGEFTQERIKHKDWVWPDRFYFYNPEGHDRRPAALYAIGYTRGGYGQSDELYRRMLDYIAENGFEICGNAYEEYPFNEVCIAEDNNYLMRVMITVCEKSGKTRSK